jgi:hypothetical protein
MGQLVSFGPTHLSRYRSTFEYRGVTGDRPYGFWWNEVSWPWNTITDGEAVANEALANILGIFDYCPGPPARGA